MIRYALRCECGHTFDSWFQNSAAYDIQITRKLVACPVCESAKVEKAIMAPSLARKGRERNSVQEEPANQAVAAPEHTAPLMMAPQERELVAKLRELRDHVTKSAENVGKRFSSEARKMHYGDIEHRAIYGEATSDEARTLLDEGVQVLLLPLLPGDRN